MHYSYCNSYFQKVYFPGCRMNPKTSFNKTDWIPACSHPQTSVSLCSKRVMKGDMSMKTPWGNLKCCFYNSGLVPCHHFSTRPTHSIHFSYNGPPCNRNLGWNITCVLSFSSSFSLLYLPLYQRLILSLLSPQPPLFIIFLL